MVLKTLHAENDDDGAEDAGVENDGAGISNFFGSEDVAQEKIKPTQTKQQLQNAEDVAQEDSNRHRPNSYKC